MANLMEQCTFQQASTYKKDSGKTKFKDIVKRRDDMVLHRVRVGHTHLTHCYQLKGEDQPVYPMSISIDCGTYFIALQCFFVDSTKLF